MLQVTRNHEDDDRSNQRGPEPESGYEVRDLGEVTGCPVCLRTSLQHNTKVLIELRIED